MDDIAKIVVTGIIAAAIAGVLLSLLNNISASEANT
jgi:hypothetical protein